MALVDKTAGSKKLYSLEEDVLIVTILKKNKGATVDHIVKTMKACEMPRTEGSIRYRIDRQLAKVDKFTELHKNATEDDVKKAQAKVEQMLAKLNK